MIESTDPYVVLLTAITALTCGLFIWFATPRDDVHQITQVRFFSNFFFLTSACWFLILVRFEESAQWNIFATNLTLYLSFFMLVNGFRVRVRQSSMNMLMATFCAALLAYVQIGFFSEESDFVYRLAMSFGLWVLVCVLIYRSLMKERRSKGQLAAQISLLLSVIAIVIGGGLIYSGQIESYEFAVTVYCMFYITLFGSISTLILFDEVAKHQKDAETDELTGLKNRRFFMERSSKLLHSGRRSDFPMSIILCDIDHFKKINDTYGHSTGDIAIKKIAKILSENVRGQDMLARFGGEEFIVILPQTDLQGAMDVAERMRVRMQQTEIVVPNSSFKLTSSFGVIEMLGLDLDANIARADKALYNAKANGRNRVEVVED